MNNENHWDEMSKMLKAHRESKLPIERLDERRMADLQANVFSHIDQQFSDRTEHSSVNDTVENRTRKNVTKATSRNILKDLLSKLFPSGEFSSRSPALAFAAVAVLALGVLTFFTGQKPTVGDTLFELPNSIAMSSEALESQIDATSIGARALATSPLSVEHDAFMAGVTRADIDVIGNIDSALSQQLVQSFNSTDLTPHQSFDKFTNTVEGFIASDTTSGWIKHGYAVELVNLTAKHAMTDLGTDELGDALAFYRIMSADLDLQTQNQNYTKNHDLLMSAHDRLKAEPKGIEQLILLTNNLKVLIR